MTRSVAAEKASTTDSNSARVLHSAEARAAGGLRGLYPRFLKRWLDLAVAGTALLLLAPLILLVAYLVRRNLGSPVIFRQPRAGRNSQIFMLYKFRSMRNALDSLGRPLADEQRLTPFGQRLRSLSLDELPQLWNILRGDMSLIGPRPLLVDYLPRYSPEQARRHDVRPGITGWAQVNGRNEVSWPNRFELDVWYVDHCSFGTDLRILWQTFFCVLSRRGVNAYNHATMPEFMGNDPPSAMTSSQEPS